MLQLPQGPNSHQTGNNRKSFAFSVWQIPLPIFQLTFQSSLSSTYKQKSFVWELKPEAGKKKKVKLKSKNKNNHSGKGE